MIENSDEYIKKSIKLIKKRKIFFKKLTAFGIILWVIVQSSWISYWTIYKINAFSEMSMSKSLICVFSILIPILIVAVSHRKYTLLSGYENIFKHIYDYSHKEDHKENI